MKRNSFDDRKQRTHLNTLFCPAASCGPGEVRGVASSLRSSDSCANRGARVKEDGKNEIAKRGTNVRANLRTCLGVSQSQSLPRQTQKFLQKNASSVKVLQKNNAERSVPSEELQTNACELKSKEHDEKALMLLPKTVPQRQQMQQKGASLWKNAFSTEKAKWNPLTDDGPWSLTPWVENASEDEWFDEWFKEVTCQVEQQKDDSFQGCTRQNVATSSKDWASQTRVHALAKTESSVKQFSSSVLLFPLLCDPRPGSDKASTAESLSQRAPEKTNLKAFKLTCAAQQ